MNTVHARSALPSETQTENGITEHVSPHPRRVRSRGLAAGRRHRAGPENAVSNVSKNARSGGSCESSAGTERVILIPFPLIHCASSQTDWFHPENQRTRENQCGSSGPLGETVLFVEQARKGRAPRGARPFHRVFTRPRYTFSTWLPMARGSSNMVTWSLPNTARSLASALIERRFCASCRPLLLM